MSLFVTIGALLALLSLALLTRPLWRRGKGGAQAAPTDNPTVTAMRQQLEQLAALKASGVLGEAQYGEARAGLERRIVDAVVAAPAAPAAAPKTPDTPARPTGLLLGLAGFLGATTIAGYALVGTPRALDPTARVAQGTPAGDGHSITAEQIEAMIDKLAARLKDKPDDADGWAMLGRSQAVLGRHDLAMPALKHAVELRANDAVLLTDYADALAVVNGRNLDGEPARLIERALAIDPNNLKALSLAGTHAFVRKDFSLALTHWEKMARLAPDDEMVKQIQGGIDEARSLAGGSALAPAAAAAPAPAAAPAATPTLAAAA
ncbi:MAG: c-type cytochrome biogenesis protein CcmI, partial [Burkholderiaceae bacterium]|nr:c-type cytochrome biogenesis protein CcmI [Burkholderiaceae bacterium]